MQIALIVKYHINAMQRSLAQVAGYEEGERQLAGLVDYIRARECYFDHGCPILLIYQYVADRGLPCSWLHGAIVQLKHRHEIFEQYGHFKTFTNYSMP